VDGLIWWGGTKKNRSRSRVALIIPRDPSPVPPWRTQDSVTAKARKIEKGSGLEWKILDRGQENPIQMQNLSIQAWRKKGQSRAGKCKTGRNHHLNVSRLRKPQGTPTIQQRNHFRPDPIKSQTNLKNTAF